MFVEGEEKTMFRCRVLYIGSAVPLEASKGLEAIQQPLRERYPYKDEKKISGVDAILSVMPTGIQMQYAGESNSLMWFPISSLTFCAAVRCIHLVTRGGQKVPQFVSLNSPAAGGIYSQKPSIFSAITRRTKGRKVLECHAFICSSTKDAINLVQSSKMADRGFRNRMVSSSVSPLSRMNTLSLRPQSESEMHLITDQQLSQNDAAPEFYEAPPVHGYFYGTGSTLIKSYTVEKINKDPFFERHGSRKSFSSIILPSHSRYVPIPKKMSVVSMNGPHPSRRFLSPPPAHLMVRKDPYIFNPQSTYARLRPPISQSVSETVDPRSPSLERSQRSSGGSTIRPEDNSLRKSHRETEIKNGRDTESTSDSSRPPSPPLDYEPFDSSRGVTKTHLSRKDRYEKSTSPSVIYPYDPYIYPAFYVDGSATRPRSLPPPVAEIEYSTKNSRKKKDKSKKKSKKSSRKGSTDDAAKDNADYSSDKQNRLMLDRSYTHQNERAFARSIVAEGKKHGIYEEQNISYRHYPDNEIVN